MVKKLRDGEAGIKQPLKKAKSFFWKLTTIIFSILFVCSIAVCVLFATGIVAIVEDEENGGLQLHFESPLVPESDTEKTPVNSREGLTNYINANDTEFTGDNVGWSATTDKKCDYNNSTCKKNNENVPSIGAFDLDISSLTYNAAHDHPDESLQLSDIKFTSNGRYAVAKFISNNTKGETVIVNELYYYRSTYNSRGWTELKNLGKSQKFDCSQISETQKLIINDIYPDRGCSNSNEY